jgi:hypothetical protein
MAAIFTNDNVYFVQNNVGLLEHDEDDVMYVSLALHTFRMGG